MNSGISGLRGFIEDGGGVGKACVQVESEHQNYFPVGTTAGAVPARNFSPLISDGMIIRGDISHESGTWLNVDFIAAGQHSRLPRGRGRGRGKNFHGITERGPREGTVYEVVN